MVLRRGGDSAFIVFDAKYRRERSNVMNAMESAHIYHDSLRIGTSKPAFCALLLPAQSDVPELDKPAFLAQHGIGTVSLCYPGGIGMTRAVSLIEQWATDFAARPTLASGPDGAQAVPEAGRYRPPDPTI